MPAVVREFVEKGTFEGSLEVQRQLIADYKEDIRKYAEGMDQTRILNVYNHIPVQLAKDNKNSRFQKWHQERDSVITAGASNGCMMREWSMYAIV